MHNFTNDGLLISNITHHFSLQDIFQIADLNSNSSLNIPTQKFVGIRIESFALDVSRKWRRIWKIQNMGFLQNGPNYI